MKKIIFSLLMLMMSVSHAFADGLSAMLQQGDSIQLFYGPQALIQAHDAADTTGAVITLSPGNFGSLTITKKNLTVIGNYGLTYKDQESTVLTGLTISANNVTVDGLYLNGDNQETTLGNINDCKIIRSCMSELNAAGTHTNTIIDQCNITYSVSAQVNSRNFAIKNSTINHFNGVNSEDYPAFISNCVVYNFRSTYVHVNTYYDYENPIAVYKNNILKHDVRGYPYFMSSPREYYNNIFIGGNLNVGLGCVHEGNVLVTVDSILTADQYPSYPINPGLGMDGTVRGPQGGTGFVEYPNIPRITGRTIDSQVDEEGKLNVKISVKAK